MKLSREELNEIIERDLPGSKLLETASDSDLRSLRAPADLDSPDIETLRERFLGKSKQATAMRASKSASPAKRDTTAATDAKKSIPRRPPKSDDDDVEIVIVTPKRPTEALDRGSRPKAVVVSSKEKKVIGRQG